MYTPSLQYLISKKFIVFSTTIYMSLFFYFRSFHDQKQYIQFQFQQYTYMKKGYTFCLGFEPRTKEWQSQTDPLCYYSNPNCLHFCMARSLEKRSSKSCFITGLKMSCSQSQESSEFWATLSQSRSTCQVKYR